MTQFEFQKRSRKAEASIRKSIIFMTVLWTPIKFEIKNKQKISN